MSNYIKNITALLIVIAFSQSCKKFVEVNPPIDKLDVQLIFKDNQTATASVLGIYARMMMATPVITSGGVTIYTGLAADEFYNANNLNPEISEFTNNALTAGNGILGFDFWYKAYSLIYHANACIIGLENNSNIDASIKDQLLGESLFIRSFVYYYLVRLYGDVPLLLGTDYEINGKAPRMSTKVIYRQIIEDLKKSQIFLNESYPTSERVLPNKWTVTALLARIYLNIEQWDLAEKETSDIINSDLYFIESDLNDVFAPLSNEAIWQLRPSADGFNTTEPRYFVPTSSASSRPNYPLTSSLLSAFETGDLRFSNWVMSKTVSGQTYYFPYKYKIRNFGLPVTEYYMIFRLAEQYLIRAECYAQLGKLEEAKKDLNILRHRAGLLDTPATTFAEIINAILKERRIELFAEWGHRWFDLKRTNKATETLSLIKPDWQPSDTLFPVPSGEIRRNPSLTQNAGY